MGPAQHPDGEGDRADDGRSRAPRFPPGQEPLDADGPGRHRRNVGHRGPRHADHRGGGRHEQGDEPGTVGLRAGPEGDGRRGDEPGREDREPEKVNAPLRRVEKREGREEGGRRRAAGEEGGDPLRLFAPGHLEGGGVKRIDEKVPGLREEDRVVDRVGLVEKREEEEKGEDEGRSGGRQRRGPDAPGGAPAPIGHLDSPFRRRA